MDTKCLVLSALTIVTMAFFSVDAATINNQLSLRQTLYPWMIQLNRRAGVNNLDRQDRHLLAMIELLERLTPPPVTPYAAERFGLEGLGEGLDLDRLKSLFTDPIGFLCDKVQGKDGGHSGGSDGGLLDGWSSLVGGGSKDHGGGGGETEVAGVGIAASASR